MPKNTAKYRKKAARHERLVQHTKRRHAKKASRIKKPLAQEEQVIGVIAVEQQTLEPDTGDRWVEGLGVDTEPAGDIVEIVEIEVASGPLEDEE